MKKIYSLIFLVFSIFTNAQNEFKIWYFGNSAGLDFSTSPPTALTNTYVNTVEGVASICDNNGNFLFYTDGTYVMDATNTYMANGTGLVGDGSSTQAAIIVKQPGNNTNYYIFTTSVGGTGSTAAYSIVDMSLAAGLGSVTVKNSLMYNGTTEKQVAIRHCNGKDIWIVQHKVGTNEFKSFLLTSAGLSSTPITSGIGTTLNGFGAAGQLKISADGKKLAMATASVSSPANYGAAGFYLFDFDASSGIVTNSLSLLTTTTFPTGCGPYGMEFSPDGTKLYGATSTLSSYSCALYQWNICASNTSAIIASQYSINIPNVNVGSLQRAIDNKLYVAMGSTNHLSVINNPNASGAAMGFSLNAITLMPNTFCSLGLPNYINGYTHTTPSVFSNTINCQDISFSVPPTPTFTSGCSATPYLPSSYLWDFGEPASGSANSSTLSSPTHNYAATGTYTVSLIIYSACTNDTLTKVVTVSTPGPAVGVTGNSVICKGDKYTYTASGATTYSWSSGSTNSSVTLSPTITTAYSVTGTTGACKTTKTFTVTVNPCTGISSISDKTAFTVFPNPFKDLLSVEASSSSELVISDLSGSPVLKSKLNEGRNDITTSELKPGIYLIQVSPIATGGGKIWRARFVKE